MVTRNTMPVRTGRPVRLMRRSVPPVGVTSARGSSATEVSRWVAIEMAEVIGLLLPAWVSVMTLPARLASTPVMPSIAVVSCWARVLPLAYTTVVLDAPTVTM